MLYHLFEWLKTTVGLKCPEVHCSSSSLSGYCWLFYYRWLSPCCIWKKTDQLLKKKQVGETVRDLGLAGEQQKKGTPTMGGIIIILAILIPTLFLANLNKAYIRLMILSTIWLGIIGFIDDYLKLRAKRIAQEQGMPYKKGDKDGLAGWFKILGQVGLGLLLAHTLYFNSNTKVWREYVGTDKTWWIQRH